MGNMRRCIEKKQTTGIIKLNLSKAKKLWDDKCSIVQTSMGFYLIQTSDDVNYINDYGIKLNIRISEDDANTLIKSFQLISIENSVFKYYKTWVNPKEYYGRYTHALKSELKEIVVELNNTKSILSSVSKDRSLLEKDYEKLLQSLTKIEVLIRHMPANKTTEPTRTEILKLLNERK